MENREVSKILNEIENLPITNDDRYDKMFEFIHRQIDKKEVMINENLQDRFGIDYRVLKFDEGYFQGGYYDPLFVCVAALADTEVYDWLKEAYDLTHEQEFSYEVLENEIERLEKQNGPLFNIDFYIIYESGDSGVVYKKRKFYTHAESPYDIDHISIDVLGDGRIKIAFVIEFDKYLTFTAFLADDEKYKRAISFPEPKKYDELYILVEDQIKDVVSEYWDSK